jgi:branched-subunit amino acid transport protein AzlD
MITSVNEALLLTIVMAAAIFFCRIFPFLFFREKRSSPENGTCSEVSTLAEKRKATFLNFVEKTVPPAAMTVLAFNAIAGPARTNPGEIIPILAAAVFTAGVHLWRRNALISIFGGTALFMLLIRII